MHSLIFFGTLRSKKLLKSVIGKNIDHLQIIDSKLNKFKLFKVKNENFPYLNKTNSDKDIIKCTYIKNLTKDNFDKILFYESVEYKLSKINIFVSGKIIKANFFELINKNKTNINWSFEKWQIKYEEQSCIAAKEWMLLFNNYKNIPEKAELFWTKMKEKAKIKKKK